MFIQCILVSLLGGLICLDRIVIQSMIARPVIAAPLVGFILGDPYTGLLIGAFIELFWLDRLPIGTYVPPNESLVAIIMTSSCIFSGRIIGHNFQEIMSFSILLYIPCGYLGQKMDIFFIELNDRLAKEALICVEKSDLDGMAAKHLQAPLTYFLFTSSFIFLFLFPGITLTTFLFPHFSPSVLNSLNLIYYFFPFLGIAVAMNTIHLHGMLTVFCGIFLVVSTILEFINAF